MALISLRQLLDHAAEHGYGVPAFNVNNMEQVQAIMQAQMDREKRLAQADDIIVNDDTLEALENKVQQLHNQYLRFAANLSTT